jgi:ABC-type transport system substrate-binding protein
MRALLLTTVAVVASGHGGTLRLAERIAPSLDPALAQTPDAVMLQNSICAPLYTIAADGEPMPGVATSMPVARPSTQRPKQWTTYRISLSPRYRFADGSPVTAWSFAEAFARDANPDVDSPALAELKNIVGVAAVAASEASTVSGVEVPGDTTLEITTMRPAPRLAALLAQPYFCPVAENTPDAPGGVAVPPSSGPYAVASNAQGLIVLRRNRFYGGARKATFGSIELRTGVGFDVCRARARAGEEDVCLDALPQHATHVDLTALAAQGWLSKRVGCLAWLPVVRLDLAGLC